MRATGDGNGTDGRPGDLEVSRLGILIAWLAVIAILLVVGAGVYLAVQGLLVTRSFPVLIVVAAFALWLAVVTYRLVRLDSVVSLPAWADGRDARSRLP